MHRLLEPQDLRKLDILSELSLTLEPYNMNELAEKLGINIKTLLVTVEEINIDAQTYNQDIQIERYSRSELKLEVANNFSVFYFKLQYLKQSFLYQFFHLIFSNEYKSMTAIADHYHISVASLYRKISKVKKILEVFDLEFDATAEFPIKGNEKQIRYFFFQFYWYSAQMFEWPFSDELKILCLRLHNQIFVDSFRTESLVLKEKIILWLAINILRIEGGVNLATKDISEMADFMNANLNFNTLKVQLDTHLSHFEYKRPLQFQEADSILFYSLLICDSDFLNEEKLTFKGTEQKIFEDATVHFLDKCTEYLNRPLTHDEYHRLYVNLFKVHMHTYFFIQKGIFMALNHRFDFVRSAYLQCLSGFDEFYKDLYEGEEKFNLFMDNPNLYHRYMIILRDNLNEESFYPDLKIALFILESQNIQNFYRNKIQSLTQSKITFIEEIIDVEDADLLISYVPLELGDDFNYFIINIPSTSWDWERLRLELNRIQKLKRSSQSLLLKKAVG